MSALEGSGPVRTCVGCRNRDHQADLVRVVAEQGSVIPNLDGRKPGRGAWLHPNTECLALAEKRRAFTRALRSEKVLDLSAITTYVVALVQSTSVERDESHERPMSAQK